MFRGREVVHSGLGKDVLDRLLETVKDICVVERPAKLEGKNMIMILAPKAALTEGPKAALTEGPKAAVSEGPKAAQQVSE